MRAHEFLTPQALDEVIPPAQQITPAQRAWLWNEFLRLLQVARKPASEGATKPKPPQPPAAKRNKPKRRKPRTGAIAPIKPQVLADPARALRRLARLQKL